MRELTQIYYEKRYVCVGYLNIFTPFFNGVTETDFTYNPKHVCNANVILICIV
jgi:hypothetical protein